MQDDRSSKRDALARTPPRTPPPAAAPARSPLADESRKKTRGRPSLEADFAAAAQAAPAPQPLTATTYITAALAAANPFNLLA